METNIASWLVQQVPVITVLGFSLYFIWGEYKTEREYNRTQDKENLEILKDMNNILDKIIEGQEVSSTEIKDLRKTVEDRTQKILDKI